jgi:subtilisin family serine protease
MRFLAGQCVLFVWCGCAQGDAYRARADVTIAIVDDGVDISRPELHNRIVTNHLEIPDNAIDDDRDGYVDDVNGYDFLDNDGVVVPSIASGDPSHGTMVALVALNAADNAIAPYARKTTVRIMPLRVANDRLVDARAVADAVSYAGRGRGRFIVNLSLGTILSSIPKVLDAAIRREPNVLFIVAAGNQGKSISDMRASLCRIPVDNLICVASIDRRGHLSTFPKASNFGYAVDIAALGVDVVVSSAKGVLQYETGSSFAAAAASGIAARVWSAAPDLSAAELARSLCAGARRGGVLGNSVECGIIDAIQSLRWIASRPMSAISVEL